MKLKVISFLFLISLSNNIKPMHCGEGYNELTSDAMFEEVAINSKCPVAVLFCAASSYCPGIVDAFAGSANYFPGIGLYYAANCPNYYDKYSRGMYSIFLVFFENGEFQGTQPLNNIPISEMTSYTFCMLIGQIFKPSQICVNN